MDGMRSVPTATSPDHFPQSCLSKATTTIRCCCCCACRLTKGQIIQARLTRRSAARLGLVEGRKVWAQIKAVALLEARSLRSGVAKTGRRRPRFVP